jgi:hypothetical protein
MRGVSPISNEPFASRTILGATTVLRKARSAVPFWIGVPEAGTSIPVPTVVLVVLVVVAGRVVAGAVVVVVVAATVVVAASVVVVGAAVVVVGRAVVATGRVVAVVLTTVVPRTLPRGL